MLQPASTAVATGMRINSRLDRLPFTRYHLLWIALLGLAFLVETFDLAVFAYVAPSVRENWNLSLEQVGVITSAGFVGMFVGAVAGGRLWFQLYYWEDRSLSHAVVDRAHELGCEALFVTLDMPVPPNREYIHRSGFGTPFRLNARNVGDSAA